MAEILYLCLIVIGVSAVQDASLPLIPTRVSHGECPSQSRQAEIRQQLSRDILTALPGLTRHNPVSSCNALHASRPSGYYWIRPAMGSLAVQVYCDLNMQCGCDGPSTWTRVALLNMSDPSHTCPNNWIPYSTPVRACGIGFDVNAIKSVTFSVHGQRYRRVCGRAIGYTYGANSAFAGFTRLAYTQPRTIDQNYLSGLSITYGYDGTAGSRQHIWSFASARGESFESGSNVCDCSNSDHWPYNTYFVGSDYFCDSGNEGFNPNSRFYPDDPLWDGAGCGPSSTCCEFNNPPWFCKTLSQSITDDLEVRLINYPINSDIPIQLIELYIQ